MASSVWKIQQKGSHTMVRQTSPIVHGEKSEVTLTLQADVANEIGSVLS